GVPHAAATALVDEFHVSPADIVVAVGPSIGACCYEVGVEVREAFRSAGYTAESLARWFRDRPQATAKNPSMPNLPEPRSEHWYFDAWTATADALENAGVPRTQVHVAGLCTASHPQAFCSYRRDGIDAGRIAAAIRCAPLRP